LAFKWVDVGGLSFGVRGCCFFFKLSLHRGMGHIFLRLKDR